jgi:excisionase family DNA binding protein
MNLVNTCKNSFKKAVNTCKNSLVIYKNMPARLKRYYTVKEAANILGVSTNTIYKYLDEGDLRAKRIGKGRFKVLASSLTPYFPGRVAKRTLGIF